MGVRYGIQFTDLSRKDFDNLDGSQKKQVLKSLVKIEQGGMSVGQPLRGKLWDCRKLKHKRLGLRVVFRESDYGIELIEIVTVGRREDHEVYDIAAARLGRF